MIIMGPDGKEYKKIDAEGNEESINDLKKEDIEGKETKITLGVDVLKDFDKSEMTDLISKLINHVNKKPEKLRFNLNRAGRSYLFEALINLLEIDKRYTILFALDDKYDDVLFVKSMENLETMSDEDYFKEVNINPVKGFIAKPYSESKEPKFFKFKEMEDSFNDDVNIDGMVVKKFKIGKGTFMIMNLINSEEFKKAEKENNLNFKEIEKNIKEIATYLAKEELYMVSLIEDEGVSDTSYFVMKPEVKEIVDNIDKEKNPEDYCFMMSCLSMLSMFDPPVNETTDRLESFKDFEDVKELKINVFLIDDNFVTARIDPEECIKFLNENLMSKI